MYNNDDQNKNSKWPGDTNRNYQTYSGRLSDKEKQEKFEREHYAREGYRNYGRARQSKFSVFYQETLASFLGILFFLVYASMVVIPLVAIASMNDVWRVLIIVLATCFIVVLFSRRIVKRLRFVDRLKKLCKNEKLRLYTYRGALRSLNRPFFSPDFAVETADTLYECAYFPAPRRLSVLRFETPEICSVVTGVVKNRFKATLGLNRERVRAREYGFEASRISTKKVIKVILLNPVPYELYYLDKKEGKVVPGGSGCEFFGYTAYTSFGFIEHLKRTVK